MRIRKEGERKEREWERDREKLMIWGKGEISKSAAWISPLPVTVCGQIQFVLYRAALHSCSPLGWSVYPFVMEQGNKKKKVRKKERKESMVVVVC